MSVKRRRFGGKAVLIHFFYDLFFLAAILLSSPYIVYRILTSARFRAGLKHRLGFVPDRGGKRRAIWIFHRGKPNR